MIALATARDSEAAAGGSLQSDQEDLLLRRLAPGSWVHPLPCQCVGHGSSLPLGRPTDWLGRASKVRPGSSRRSNLPRCCAGMAPGTARPCRRDRGRAKGLHGDTRFARNAGNPRTSSDCDRGTVRCSLAGSRTVAQQHTTAPTDINKRPTYGGSCQTRHDETAVRTSRRGRLRSDVAQMLSRPGGPRRKDDDLRRRCTPVRYPVVAGRVRSLGVSLEGDRGGKPTTPRTAVDDAGCQQEERHARARVFPGHRYRPNCRIRAARSPSGTPAASLGVRLAGLTMRVGEGSLLWSWCSNGGGGVGARMRAGLRASNRRARHLPMRYETGLPSSVIRFRTLHASTASRRCPDELRARRQSPTIDVYRKNAFSTRAC